MNSDTTQNCKFLPSVKFYLVKVANMVDDYKFIKDYKRGKHKNLIWK